MHNPQHVVAIVNAAQLLIEQMDKKGLLPAHLPGFICVANRDLFQLACVHIAPFGHFCSGEDIALKLRTRTLKVRDQIHNNGDIPDGTTSSDVRHIYGGAVAAKQLITAWASRDGVYPLGEEAVAIMINIMAGVLPRNAVRKRFCNHLLGEHNSDLRRLLDNITCTK